MVIKRSNEGQEPDEYLTECMLLCVNNPTGGMRLLACSFTSAFNRKGDTAAGACICLLFMVVLDGHLFQFSHLMFDYLEKKKNLHSMFFSLQENNVFHSVSWEIFSLHKVFVFLAFTLAQ